MDLHRRRAVTGIFFAAIFSVNAASVFSAGADFSGQIRMEPPFPESKMIQVKKKVQDSCADEQMSQSLQVSPEGGVANAVVWIEGNFEAQVSEPLPVTLNQTRCNFEPHVSLIPPGGRLRVLNSDPLAHDVRSFDASTMLYRLDMDTGAKPEERSYEKPGIYTIRCGLHPWMHAFAVQAAHPFYAVTDAKGLFMIREVPAGQYTLHIWHETLGEQTQPLAVTGPAADFSYTFKKA